jgi:PAS domain S-box-containing protein
MTLRESHPFEDLFEQARHPAFILDPNADRIVAANPAGAEHLGLSREEALRSTISQFHPGELQQLQAFVRDVLRDGHGTTVTLTCRTATGECLPTEMALYAFEGGEGVQLLALVQDRSQHRHAPVAAEAR